MKPGVYQATRKNGEIYYRGNVTYNGRHISIGSFDTEAECNSAYREAWQILKDEGITLLTYQNHIKYLPFEKCITLINFRDNKMYIKIAVHNFNMFI